MFQAGDKQSLHFKFLRLEAKSLSPNCLTIYFIFYGNRVYNLLIDGNGGRNSCLGGFKGPRDVSVGDLAICSRYHYRPASRYAAKTNPAEGNVSAFNFKTSHLFSPTDGHFNAFCRLVLVSNVTADHTFGFV